MTTTDDEDVRRYFRDDEPGDHDTPDDTHDPANAANEVDARLRCDWHLRKLAAIRAELATVDAVYRAELDRLQARHTIRRDRLAAAAAWHETPLTSYALMRRDRDDVKTLELPNGAIRTTRRKTPKVTVDDEVALAAWAALAHDPVPVIATWRSELVIDKRALTTYVADSGEVPPGVTVTPPTTTVVIDTEATP